MKSSTLKYIAIFLLLVFLMPMQYRFLHVLEHHFAGNPINHHSHINLHHNHENHHNCNHNDDPKGDYNLNETIDICPVVEYEFAVSDEPAIDNATSKPDFSANTENIFHLTLINSYSGTQKQLRAPPQS